MAKSDSRSESAQDVEARYRRNRSDRLDAILRRVNQVGVDGLGSEEREYLERVSDELALELDVAASEPDRDAEGS